ncbi:auxin-responsive protein SAUR32-like [Syzygium oleosum]|uniref:auxin-responsive protein SAUR32-like n=1 Tax=Syzygium oleosum TaxID=219896 RepID=UPI0011D1D428|nr:auxin-responsive protein SAUR32-like [Syzygium oleosum]
MGSGDKLFHLHLPHHHHHQRQEHDVPKGCLAVMVGQGEGERRRFVIPVMYVNHPRFVQLLKEAEEEFGFDQKGPITIPCHVEEFRSVQESIDRESSPHHHHHHHPSLGGWHGHHHAWCFRV